MGKVPDLNGKANTVLTTITLGVAAWGLLTVLEMKSALVSLSTELKMRVESAKEEHRKYDTALDKLDSRLRVVEENTSVPFYNPRRKP